MSSLKSREDTIEKLEEAVDYVNDRLPNGVSSVAAVRSSPSTIYPMALNFDRIH